jgi:hypothetical protein
LAAVTIDLADMISAAVEARSRKAFDADLTGGLVFSARRGDRRTGFAGSAVNGTGFVEGDIR